MDFLKLLVPITLMAFAVAWWLFAGWLFFQAPCETVKTYFAITNTPARCL